MKYILNKKLLYVLYFAIFFVILFAFYLQDILKANLFTDIEFELAKKIAISRVHMDRNAFEQNNSALLKEYADEIKQTTGLRATLINKTGIVLADSDIPVTRLNDVENHLLREEVQEALRSGTGLAIRRSATIDNRLLYYCETIKKEGRVIGFIRIAMLAPEIDAKIIFIRGVIWRASIVLILGVVLASLALVMMYSRSQRSIVKDILRQKDNSEFMSLSDDKREEFHQIISAINRYGNKLHKKMYKNKEKRKRLGFLYDYLKEGIALFDANGHVLFFNKAFLRILQIDEDKSFDEPFYYWIHFPPLVQDMGAIQTASERIKRKLKYTDERYIEYELIPPGADLPELPEGSFILKVNDITLVQQLEKVRQDFITNASHELNTPLALISGYLETLLSGRVEEKNKQFEFLNKIQKQASLLENLVRDLNDLSKSDNQAVDSKINFELKSHLIEIAADYKTRIEEKNLTLVQEFDTIPDNLEICSFQNYLTKIVTNLLDNAIQYNSSHGKIYFRADRTEDLIRIEIEDTGIGIVDSEKDRIFELFYRTEDARQMYTEGTGMGLTIVHNFVQRLKGNVGIKTAIGKGTTVWFEFPLEQL